MGERGGEGGEGREGERGEEMGGKRGKSLVYTGHQDYTIELKRLYMDR